MSVIAISPRMYPPTGPVRPGTGRRWSAPPGDTSTVTVTFDISLGGEPLTPYASRLLELVRDLVEQGDGTVALAQPVSPTTIAQPRPFPAVAAPGDSAAVEPSVLRILAGSRVVLLDGEQVPLTRLEFELLLFLAQHPRRVFTRVQLLSHVWGYEHAVARTVDVHVRRLRAKVGESVPVVTTVYGVGYRLADDGRISVERDG